MKILLINNYHYSRDGVTRAYFDLAKILTDHGHEVAFFSSHAADESPTPWSRYFVSATDFEERNIGFLSKAMMMAKGFYNFEAKIKLQALIDEFHPDIAHLHNIYHHLSPSILGVFKKNNIPAVMTLHDYALVSSNYNLFANGRIWEGDRGGKYWRCFTDRCIKNSFWRSFLAMLESYFYHSLKSYDKIDQLISPSRFLIGKFKEFGFEKEIDYLPNPFLSPDVAITGKDQTGRYIIYFGRLSAEKGVADLLRAYARLKTEVKLKIVGVGPLENELKKIVAQENIANVEFLGYKIGTELWQLIGGAELTVCPSRWYENAPYSVIEPMGLGKVVLASRLGGNTELINERGNGFLFVAGDINDLENKMAYIIANPQLADTIGSRAAETVRKNNSPEKFYGRLVEIYQKIIKK
jgi:glycosyltransferase involved in cell wall biosynthesis